MRAKSILHRDVIAPAETDTSRLPDAFTKRTWLVDVQMMRKAELWGEGRKPAHGAVIHDAQALIIGLQVCLG